MKTNKREILIEKEAEKIQKMPLKQWRKTVAKQSVVLFQNNGEIVRKEEEIEIEKEVEAEKLQKFSLKELRNLHKQTKALSAISLEEKATITGLSQTVIQKLETQKEKATLEEIMTYCSRLKIPFREFLPELFSPQIAFSNKP